MSKRKAFTLIEMLIVIVILSVLAAIIIPNVQSLKEDAIKAEITANMRNLQTAVDKYSMKHEGEYPAPEQPTLENPQKINYHLLYPKDIRDKEPKHGYYWVDVMGKVWGSTIDGPENIHYDEVLEQVSWKANKKTAKYELFTINNSTAAISEKILSSSNKTFTFKSLGQVLNMEGKKVMRANLSTESNVYLISAYDELGFPTPPFGTSYQGPSNPVRADDNYSIYLPLNAVGTFYLTTHASDNAVWDGISVRETKPEGTDIRYSFATSNDGKSYSDFSTDIKSLPHSEYMKVKIELMSSNNNKPTLHMLKVHFHLVSEADSFIPVNLVDNLIKSSNTQTNAGDLGSSISLADGSKTGSVEHIVVLPENLYIDEITPIFQTPNTGGVKQTYQSSVDGKYYSNPTVYPEELPKGKYVKINTTINEGTNGEGNPVLNGILVKTTTSNPNVLGSDYYIPSDLITKNQDTWISMETLEIIEDAGQIGDWLKVNIVDKQPVGTRILYSYYTSDDGYDWNGPYSSVDKAPNSKLLKVKIEYQRQLGIEESPILEEISIEYKLLNGTPKGVTLTPNGDGTFGKTSINYPPTAVITMNPSSGVTTMSDITWSYANSKDPNGDQVVAAEWRLDGVLVTNPNGKINTSGSHKMELRVKDSKGLWSSWVSKSFSVGTPTPEQALYISYNGTQGIYDMISHYYGGPYGPTIVSRDGSLAGKTLRITAAGYGTTLNLPYSPSYSCCIFTHEQSKATIDIKLDAQGRYSFGYRYTDSWFKIYSLQIIN